MRNLWTRVEALETGAGPFVSGQFHLIGQPAGTTEEQALAAYEAENGRVGGDDRLIYLVGLEPGGDP